MKTVGIDVGSTTVKAVVAEDGRCLWQDYQRHNTRQAEKVLEFLTRMEAECALAPGRDRVFFTGSGAGFIAPLVGGKLIQEVVAVAAAVERLHPEVRFVSEIGGEDMKTIFFTPTGNGKSKQVYMQSACSGGTGTFIEKTANKLQIPPERLVQMRYAGHSLHKISSKCGIFAEADANTLVKAGVPVEEIIASLIEAVVYQNLATLTKGNTPMPEVLLLGGPNLFFQGLQEAWRHHLKALWAQRRVPLPEGREPESLVHVPKEALYYACLGCVEIGKEEAEGVGVYRGTDRLRWWIEEGQHAQKAKEGARGLVTDEREFARFLAQYGAAGRKPGGAGGGPHGGSGLIQLRSGPLRLHHGAESAAPGSGSGPQPDAGVVPAQLCAAGPVCDWSGGPVAHPDCGGARAPQPGLGGDAAQAGPGGAGAQAGPGGDAGVQPSGNIGSGRADENGAAVAPPHQFRAGRAGEERHQAAENNAAAAPPHPWGGAVVQPNGHGAAGAAAGGAGNNGTASGAARGDPSEGALQRDGSGAGGSAAHGSWSAASGNAASAANGSNAGGGRWSGRGACGSGPSGNGAHGAGANGAVANGAGANGSTAYGSSANGSGSAGRDRTGPVVVGCDFGSTTAKAVVLSGDGALVFSCYVMSRGNPIEDAKSLFRQIREAGYHDIGGLALTGYGKDLLKDIVGADVAVVETVAHATAALHFFPDADVICDVGGCDVKIMLLRQGTVSDFRLNSQCSSGNGAFLQGVAERYGIPLEQYAEKAFRARAMPTLTMGCGVFLQSDIVNQQRKGWSAEEIMASLAAVLPLNVWVYAGQLQNLRAVGRKFVLQGGTHRNLAVVKAQVDFITSKVPDAEIVVHPYSGEAGAIGAALCAVDWRRRGEPSRFRGFDVIESLTYTCTTSEQTVCHWCPCNCKRTFIDVRLPDGKGRPWSKVPLAEGWQRVISGNSCPKGLLEDVNEMKVVKAKLEEVKRAFPNVAEMVRKDAFRRSRVGGQPA